MSGGVIDHDRIDRLRLARAEGVGPITFRRLMDRYGQADAAIAALPELAAAGGRAAPPSVPSRDAAEREIERVDRLGAALLFLGDHAYPPLLAALEDAPPVVSVLGDVASLSDRAVAIVGGRNASANGQRLAELLGADLARAGLVVVSGLARGVDAAAHEGALRAGRTVAAIAGGLDIAYPPENADLQRRIAENGTLIAEAPPGTAPQARHFPRRNRVIAGLTLGVVVVEAAPRSGSLITARIAREADREVFAVPGSPLDPRCRGSNDLLRGGAWLTESAADVIDNLPPAPEAARPMGFAEAQAPFATPAEDAEAAMPAVLRLLGPSPTPVDDLLRRCQFSASAVMAALLGLELAGRLEMRPGNLVCLLGEPGV